MLIKKKSVLPGVFPFCTQDYRLVNAPNRKMYIQIQYTVSENSLHPSKNVIFKVFSFSLVNGKKYMNSEE